MYSLCLDPSKIQGCTCEILGSLLLVLGEGPGLVGDGGEGDPLARGGPDEPIIGSHRHNLHVVSSSKYGQRSALYLS